MNEYLDILCICPIFAGKEKNEIENILSLSKHKVCYFARNDFIFRADQPPDYIGIILNGSVEVQNNLISGKFINIFYKKQGEVFGGALVFSNNSTYQFDIIAKEPCNILLIHKQSLLDIFCKDSIIASNILSSFVNSVFMLNKKIELFSYSSIQEKIAYSLLHNMNSYKNNVIHLPYSKKAWAEHLNVSRSSLCRELKVLDDEGIINVNNKTISILNKAKLEFILSNI